VWVPPELLVPSWLGIQEKAIARLREKGHHVVVVAFFGAVS